MKDTSLEAVVAPAPGYFPIIRMVNDPGIGGVKPPRPPRPG